MGRVLLLALLFFVGCRQAPARAVQPLDKRATLATAATDASALTRPSAVKRLLLPRSGLLHGR
jgi:hypothetical protein